MDEQKSARRCGFTLVELLVTVAIVGILAALLLPTLAQSKQNAQRVQCVGNLHQLGLAMQIFEGEYNCYPTWGAPSNSDLPGRWWTTQLERVGFGVSNPETNFYLKGVWRCPGGPARERSLGDLPFYGYNTFGVLKVGNRDINFGLGGLRGQGPNGFRPIRDTEVAVPSDMMAIGDCDGFEFMRNEAYDFHHLVFHHGNKVNVVFCDGHVESPTLQILFDDTSDAALRKWNRDHQPHAEALPKSD